MDSDRNDLRSWFQGQIGQAEEICLLGHSLGGDLARYLSSEFPQIQSSDSPGWWLSGYGKDPAS